MTTPQDYRGADLGLPRTGSGSLAATGARLGAFVVDAVASTLVAALFVHRHGSNLSDRLPGSWSLIPLAVDYVLGTLVAGRTLGMYLLGLRLVRVHAGSGIDRSRGIDPLRILVRTALLFVLVPAVVFDRDGRGLHDRLTDSAVVRS